MTDKPDDVAAHDQKITNHYELAWAAGFFDGEGCTTARYVKSDRIRPGDLRIAVVQTDLEVLRRFHRAVLGCGSIRTRRVARGKPMWVWCAQSFEEAQAVVALLWLFLSEPKRRQILSVFRKLDLNDRRRRAAA